MLKGMPVIIFVLIRQKSKMAVTEMKYTYFTAVWLMEDNMWANLSVH